ncbi:MAG: corrinoid protein [Christensenellales bacterium]|jgi:5-methyltetrahydrofolate--homocysteine methyltransferase
MQILNEIAAMLMKGRAKEVKELVQTALDSGVTPKDILEKGLIAGMSVIGEKFKANEVFVPEVLIAARAMNAGLEVLKPHLISSGVKPSGKALICTVRGDLHDIGKNLVKMMIEGQGIEVIDLGVDAKEDKVIDAVKLHKPDILCLSALLTTTMPSQKEIIDALIKAGLRDKVKVMIGGAPVTAEYAKSIGADAYSPDAASAAVMAKSLLS